jgi:hypothetical protein
MSSQSNRTENPCCNFLTDKGNVIGEFTGKQE